MLKPTVFFVRLDGNHEQMNKSVVTPRSLYSLRGVELGNEMIAYSKINFYDNFRNSCAVIG